MHAFDPTTRLRALHGRIASTLKLEAPLRPSPPSAGSVHFHFAGLGRAVPAADTQQYGAIDSSTLMTIDAVIAQLNHTARGVDILKLDVSSSTFPTAPYLRSI